MSEKPQTIYVVEYHDDIIWKRSFATVRSSLEEAKRYADEIHELLCILIKERKVKVYACELDGAGCDNPVYIPGLEEKDNHSQKKQ